MNAISAVTSGRRLYFRFKRDRQRRGINNLDVIAFLAQLLRRIPGPLVVVWDNAPQHHSRALRAFLEGHRRLRIVFLPGYSPDFNPDEGVWGFVKWGRLGNFAARDEKELEVAAWRAMRTLQRRQGTIGGFWRHSALPLAGLRLLLNIPEND